MNAENQYKLNTTFMFYFNNNSTLVIALFYISYAIYSYLGHRKAQPNAHTGRQNSPSRGLIIKL